MFVRTLLSGRRAERDPPGYDELAGRPDTEDSTITYRESRYSCRVVSSPDEKRQIAFGRRADGSESRLFLFNGDQLIAAPNANHPVEATIANDGTAAVVEGSPHNELGGRIRVLSPTGTDRHIRTFETNVEGVAISPDGRHVATLTRPPNRAIHLFDAEDGTELANRPIEFNRAVLAGVVDHKNEPLTYLTDSKDGRPYLAVSPDGTPVWRSERFRDTEPLSDRVRRLVRGPDHS